MAKQVDLFNLQIEKNNDTFDETQIATTILYMSEDELRLFKKLCKIGIKELFKDDYQKKGNYTDLILHLLKKEYANN